MDIMREVLEACIGTATAPPLKLKQGDKYKEVHGQLHVMLLLPFGGGKTTLLESAPPEMCVHIEDYTLPSLLGSITKQGQLVDGYIQKAAGKCLVVDEFHSLQENSRRALLKLLEQQNYTRALGYKMMAVPRPKNSKHLRMVYTDNSIGIRYARFSCLCSGIFAPKKHLDDLAYSSRFLHQSLRLDIDNIMDLGRGKRELELKPVQMTENMVFPDYLKLWECYKEVLENMPDRQKAFFVQNPGFLLRDCLHISRMAAYASKETTEVSDWEKYVPWIPFFLYNCVASTLTYTEFKVLEAHKNGLNGVETAAQDSVSEKYVSETMKKLRGLGLVQ